MALIQQLIMEQVRQQQSARARGEQSQRQSALVQQLMGRGPSFDELPPDQMGPPELTDPGSGLLADPRDLENQLRFGAGLMGSPDMTAMGANVIQTAIRQSYQDRRALQDRQLTAEMARERIAQGDSEFNRTMTRAEYWKRKEDARNQTAEDIENVFGKMGEGMVAALNPMGQPFVHGVRGSKPHRQGLDILETDQGAIEELDELIGMVEDNDRPGWGESRARMDSLRGDIIARIFKRRGYGTPQAAEMERVEEELKSHEWSFTFKPTLLASLRQAREAFRKEMLRDREQYRWWPGFEKFYQNDFGASLWPPVPPELAAHTVPDPRSYPSGTTQGLGAPQNIQRGPLPPNPALTR